MEWEGREQAIVDCTEGGKKWPLQKRGRGLVERNAGHSHDSHSSMT